MNHLCHYSLWRFLPFFLFFICLIAMIHCRFDAREYFSFFFLSLPFFNPGRIIAREAEEAKMVETERAIFVSLEVTPRWLHCAIPQAPLFAVVCPTICQTDSHSYLWNETKWTRFVKIYIVYKIIVCLENFTSCDRKYRSIDL